MVTSLGRVDDAIDSAHAHGHLQFALKDVGFEIKTGDVNLVLQDTPIEVDNIDTAIGPTVNADWPEPLIRGTQELTFLKILVREKFVLRSAQTLVCLLE